MEQVRNLAPARQPTAGIIASSVYSAGKRIADIPIEEAGVWAARPGHVVWIGLLEPDRNLLLRVQAQFHLHDLAIEDADAPDTEPKMIGDMVRELDPYVSPEDAAMSIRERAPGATDHRDDEYVELYDHSLGDESP